MRWCPAIVRARGLERRFDDVVPALKWKRRNLGLAGVVVRERDGKELTR